MGWAETQVVGAVSEPPGKTKGAKAGEGRASGQLAWCVSLCVCMCVCVCAALALATAVVCVCAVMYS